MRSWKKKFKSYVYRVSFSGCSLPYILSITLIVGSIFFGPVLSPPTHKSASVDSSLLLSSSFTYNSPSQHLHRHQHSRCGTACRATRETSMTRGCFSSLIVLPSTPTLTPSSYSPPFVSLVGTESVWRCFGLLYRKVIIRVKAPS